ncbi:hypothetical protein [Streptomyces anandii]|uniref:hypothetical protein n=1 Tax=Streptomyces anandii TaxID=285454 RepID=UPI0036B4A4F5
MLMSVDPGNRVGVATFKDDGTDISRTIMGLPQFRKFLAMVYFQVQTSGEKLHFLYEDYTLRKDMAIAQTGSDMPASRCIGAVEMTHDLLGDRSTIDVSLPSNLRTALKWAGFPELANKPRTWHCPDDLSAYSHGVMWLINKNVRKHPLFES